MNILPLRHIIILTYKEGDKKGDSENFETIYVHKKNILSCKNDEFINLLSRGLQTLAPHITTQ